MVARSVRDAEVPGSSPGTPTAGRTLSRVSAAWSLEIPLPPDAALARITLAINRPKKRAFGIFKLQNEYVGVVGDREFEIWERQKRAVHALGSVHSRQGGARLAVRYVVGKRTPVLVAVFFVLYAAAAFGFSQLDPEPAITSAEIAVAFIGGAVLAGIFAAGAAQQRAELQAFIERLFADLPKT